MSVCLALLPLVLGTALASVVLVTCGIGWALQLLPGAGVLVVSVLAHELGHAAALRASSVTYVVSPGGVRVIVGGGDQPRRWRAAVAGPMSGAAVGAVGVVGALAARAGLDVALALATSTGDALSLTPWAADGRLLAGRGDDPTTTETTPSTTPRRSP